MGVRARARARTIRAGGRMQNCIIYLGRPGANPGSWEIPSGAMRKSGFRCAFINVSALQRRYRRDKRSKRAKREKSDLIRARIHLVRCTRETPRNLPTLMSTRKESGWSKGPSLVVTRSEVSNAAPYLVQRNPYITGDVRKNDSCTLRYDVRDEKSVNGCIDSVASLR